MSFLPFIDRPTLIDILALFYFIKNTNLLPSRACMYKVPSSALSPPSPSLAPPWCGEPLLILQVSQAHFSWLFYIGHTSFGALWVLFLFTAFHVVQFSSVQSLGRVRLFATCSTPGLPVHHQLPERAQTHVHRVSDAIRPSHPLSCPSPPAFSLSQCQGLSK